MNTKFLYLAFLIILFSCNKSDDDGNTAGYSTEDDLITLTLLDSDLNESSGLIMIDGIIWTHNDSGDEPKIYSIPEDEPDIDEKVKITNAIHKDWEDLAQDETHLYIGDFGNNSGERQDLTIYKVLKAELPEDTEAEAIYFLFSDQTSFDNMTSMHNFDCEAMIAFGDNLYVFTKNHVDQRTKVYEIPKTPGVHVAQRMDIFDTDGIITGAEIDSSSNTLCLTGYNANGLDFDPFVWIFYDFTGTDFFGGTSKRVDLPIQNQIEGICHKGNGKYLLSSEDENGTEASLYLFDAEKWK